MHTARNIGLERTCGVVSKRAIVGMTLGQTVENFALPPSIDTERSFLPRTLETQLASFPSLAPVAQRNHRHMLQIPEEQCERISVCKFPHTKD